MYRCFSYCYCLTSFIFEKMFAKCPSLILLHKEQLLNFSKHQKCVMHTSHFITHHIKKDVLPPRKLRIFAPPSRIFLSRTAFFFFNCKCMTVGIPWLLAQVGDAALIWAKTPTTLALLLILHHQALVSTHWKRQIIPKCYCENNLDLMVPCKVSEPSRSLWTTLRTAL